MKNFLFFLILFISNISYSQTLQNTEWELYIDDIYEVNMLFGTDTLFISDSDIIFPISIFNDSSDTFNINDIQESNSCFDEVGDYWASYLFEISNDTLRFHIIEDSCEIRAEVLSFPNSYFVRESTSTEELHSFDDVSIFPNPFGSELLKINAQEKLDQISIYDAFGRLLVSSQNNTSFDLSQYPPQVFFVELVKGKNRTVRKVIKI